jgi:integrase
LRHPTAAAEHSKKGIQTVGISDSAREPVRRSPGAGVSGCTWRGEPVSAVAARVGGTRPAPRPGAVRGARLLEDYRAFCATLDRGTDARGLRLRQAARFLAAYPDLNAWMSRPAAARLADLRRFKAWPLLTFAVLSGALRLDADLLASKRLGGFGRCAEDQFAGQFAALRQAAARLSWSPRHIEAIVRQGVVTAIAFTGKPPHELTGQDLDELDAQIAESPRLSAAERHRRRKLARGVRELLYEARIVNTPAGSGRTSVPPEGRLAAAVNPPEIRRAMTAYLAARSAQLRPGSITGMANDLACFGEFLGAAHPGITSLCELTRSHIDEFAVFARTRGYRGHRAGEQHAVGPSAAAHAMITLRCFLDDITAWGWAGAPARRLVFSSDIPRQPRLLPRALPADIDAALMDSISRHRDPFARAGLAIIRGTGLRIGELLDLELDCVVDYGTTGSWLRVPLGKLATERAVPLDDSTLACLDDLIRHRGPQRALPHPRLGRDADFVFVERGRRIVPGRLRRALRQAADDAGLAGTDGQPLRGAPPAPAHLRHDLGERGHVAARPDGPAGPSDTGNDPAVRHARHAHPARSLRRGDGQDAPPVHAHPGRAADRAGQDRMARLRDAQDPPRPRLLLTRPGRGSLPLRQHLRELRQLRPRAGRRTGAARPARRHQHPARRRRPPRLGQRSCAARPCRRQRHRHAQRPHPSRHRSGLDTRSGMTTEQATYPVTQCQAAVDKEFAGSLQSPWSPATYPASGMIAGRPLPERAVTCSLPWRLASPGVSRGYQADGVERLKPVS